MIDMNKLLESVKRHEGYRNKVYLDTLGKRTVGVGHLCVENFWEDDKEYDEDFLMGILEKDLQSAIDQADDMCSNLTISDDAKIIIIEMIFQLGGTEFPSSGKCGRLFSKIHPITLKRLFKCLTHVGQNRHLTELKKWLGICRSVWYKP